MIVKKMLNSSQTIAERKFSDQEAIRYGNRFDPGMWGLRKINSDLRSF